MKFGIVGTGSIARTHARAILSMDGCGLHSVFNPSPGKAAAFTAEFGGTAHTDAASFFQDPDLEIVTIATPSGAHFEAALSALQAGKHVACEKPLEITTDRIDMLADAAETNGKVLAAILNRRFTPAMDLFKAACNAGRFGKITSASCYVKWFRDQAYYDSAAWRGTLALDGGGALMNQAIHAIDALLHLAGPVKSVRATSARLAHERIEVEDIATAILEFESGARGVIEGSTCCWSKSGHPVRIQVCGTEGSVFLADEAFEAWEFSEEGPEDGRIRETFSPDRTAGLGANDPKAIGHLQHQRNLSEIVSAIREGREPSTSAAEARKAVELIQAIYQSAARDGEKTFV